MELSQEVKSRREALGLTQSALAELVSRKSGKKYSQQSLAKLESNPGSGSRFMVFILDVLLEQERAAGIDRPGHTSNVEQASAPNGAKRRLAPIISWVQAGEWNEAVDMYAPGFGEAYELVDDNDGPHVFWLRVKGDSMTSPTGVSIPEGYLIKVDPDARAESGSLVVAKLEDTQEVTFKKLVIDAGQKYLKPLNPTYRTIPINGNCRIVGVVKEVRLKL